MKFARGRVFFHCAIGHGGAAVERSVERNERFGEGILGDLGVVIARRVFRERRLVDTVAEERAAVREQEHQQPVVVDGPRAGELAALVNLLLDAVPHPVDREVGQLGDARRPRGVPGVGERPRRRASAQPVSARRRQADTVACAGDAARVAELLDEGDLTVMSPAVVAMAKLGGDEGGDSFSITESMAKLVCVGQQFHQSYMLSYNGTNWTQ